MEAEAEKRKLRLQALRKRKLQSEAKDQTNGDKPELSFRNYQPTDENLKKNTNIATPDDINNTVEQETRNITKEALEEAERLQKEEIDLFSLAPKRANWDLKRDVEKKLESLDKLTQRAIAEIIRERLKSESKTGTDLAEAVADAEAAQRMDEADEDED
ncbi:mRNA splicing factor [Umbelopsis sp. PMI_123]|nr:mRNA splicing factor [Umbelopsis sp. PMI_123]